MWGLGSPVGHERVTPRFRATRLAWATRRAERSALSRWRSRNVGLGTQVGPYRTTPTHRVTRVAWSPTAHRYLRCSLGKAAVLAWKFNWPRVRDTQISSDPRRLGPPAARRDLRGPAGGSLHVDLEIQVGPPHATPQISGDPRRLGHPPRRELRALKMEKSPCWHGN